MTGMTAGRVVASEIVRLHGSVLIAIHVVCGLAAGLVCGAYFAAAPHDPGLETDAFFQVLGAFMPLMAAIVVAINIETEREAGDMANLLGIPSRRLGLAAKVLVLWLLGLLTLALAALAYCLSVALAGGTGAPITAVALATLGMAGGSLCLYLFSIALALRLGRNTTIAIGVPRHWDIHQFPWWPFQWSIRPYFIRCREHSWDQPVDTLHLAYQVRLPGNRTDPGLDHAGGGAACFNRRDGCGQSGLLSGPHPDFGPGSPALDWQVRGSVQGQRLDWIAGHSVREKSVLGIRLARHLAYKAFILESAWSESASAEKEPIVADVHAEGFPGGNRHRASILVVDDDPRITPC